MIGWIDASSGASGDMLLGAVHDVLAATGARTDVMAEAAAAVVPVDIIVGHEVRGGFRVARTEVAGREPSPPRRTWVEVRHLLERADLDEPVRDLALVTFEALAGAEAAVHGVDPAQIHFHEVGAHDAIGDIVGVCAGVAALGLEALVVSPIALGGGTAQTSHGEIPIPGPAVLELLRHSGLAAHGGPVDSELCTPTGAALLGTLAAGSGSMPAMTVTASGVGAGSRDHGPGLRGLRLVIGETAAGGATDAGGASDQILETNVDDLDPRLWPGVLARLMSAGASDAWLTPILMKKGRPAHTLHVLVGPDPLVRKQIEDIVFAETSAIGLRSYAVAKLALARRAATVRVQDRDVRVKIALRDGQVVNVQPEFDDVAHVAAVLALPVKAVLSQAISAALTLSETAPTDH